MNGYKVLILKQMGKKPLTQFQETLTEFAVCSKAERLQNLVDI